MSSPATVTARDQAAAAAQTTTIFPPPQPSLLDLQSRRLLARFSMPPATARVVAALAFFAAEVRA